MLGGWCRLGVLVEVNCETDFVARGDKFKELVADMAMQIAACDVSVVAAEDAPAEEVERERAIEMQKEDIQSKPEAIRYTTLYRVHEFWISGCSDFRQQKCLVCQNYSAGLAIKCIVAPMCVFSIRGIHLTIKTFFKISICSVHEQPRCLTVGLWAGRECLLL